MSPREQSPTPAPFSHEEMAAIRKAFSDGAQDLRCPRCGTTLEVGQPLGAGGTIPPVHEIRCNSCKRSVLAGQGR